MVDALKKFTCGESKCIKDFPRDVAEQIFGKPMVDAYYAAPKDQPEETFVVTKIIPSTRTICLTRAKKPG